jgi:hypothetical protein
VLSAGSSRSSLLPPTLPKIILPLDPCHGFCSCVGVGGAIMSRAPKRSRFAQSELGPARQRRHLRWPVNCGSRLLIGRALSPTTAILFVAASTVFGQAGAPDRDAGKTATIRLQNAILSTKQGQRTSARLTAQWAPELAALEKRQVEIQAESERLERESKTPPRLVAVSPCDEPEAESHRSAENSGEGQGAAA